MRFAVRVLIGAVVVIGVAAGAALWGLILVNRAGPLGDRYRCRHPEGQRA